MRILAVSHPCITDVNQQLYAELEQLGHQVELIVPANFRTAYSRGPVKVTRWPGFAGGIVQKKVGLSGSIPLHFYRSRLKPVMERFRPDVLFVEEEPYSVSAWQAFWASRDLGVKRVIYSAQNIHKTFPPPFNWMERYVLSRSDLAVVVSEQVKTVLEQKRYGGETLQFPLGVNTDQFRPMEEVWARKRAELGVENRFVVGYVGRFVEEKGIFTLLEALELAKDQPLHFVFVGNGPLLPDIEKAKALYPDRVTIATDVKHREVHLWMNAFDVLVLPSLTKPNWKEQFGRVILEAMACKVPVIGSDSGEIPVLLKQTGGGWTFPEGDARALLERIRYVGQEPAERQQAANRGFEAVHNHFSKKAIAALLANKLESLKNQPANRVSRHR